MKNTTKKKRRGPPKGSRNAAIDDAPLVPALVKMPRALYAAAKKAAGYGKFSAFVREAVEEKLSRP